MKNIKIIIAVFAVSLFAVSCETYDDYEERITVVGFRAAVGGPNAIVPAGGSLVKEINVFTSDISNSTRTFNVVVDTEASVLSSDNYSIGIATIPANERDGIFSITFNDISLTSEFQTLRLKFEDSSLDYVSGNGATLQVRK